MPHDIVTDTFMFCRSVGSLCYVATLVTAGQQASLVPGVRQPARPTQWGGRMLSLPGSSVIVLLFRLEINHGVELLGGVPKE